MTRNNLVADERHRPSPDVLGQLAIRQAELFRRVKEGSVPSQPVIDFLQKLIEGSASPTQTTLNLILDGRLAFEEWQERLQLAVPAGAYNLLLRPASVQPVEIQLVGFGRSIEPEQAWRLITAADLHLPTDLRPLLAMADQYAGMLVRSRVICMLKVRHSSCDELDFNTYDAYVCTELIRSGPGWQLQQRVLDNSDEFLRSDIEIMTLKK